MTLSSHLILITIELVLLIGGILLYMKWKSERRRTTKESIVGINLNHYVEYLKSNTWEELRLQAVKRANHRCELCQAAYEIVHHVIQPQKYEEDDLTNLLVICGACYTKVSKEEPIVQSMTAIKEVALLSTASTPAEEELVVLQAKTTKEVVLLSTASTPAEEDPVVEEASTTKEVALPSTPPIVASSGSVTSTPSPPPRLPLRHRSFLQRYGGCLFAEKVMGVAQNYFFYVFLLSKQERLLMIIQESYDHKRRFAGDYIAISEEGLLDFNTYFEQTLDSLKIRAEKSKNRRDFFTNELLTDHSTYFFDAKIAVNGQQYLKITHSQRKDGNNVKRSHIMILEEEFDLFTSGLNSTMNFLLKR